MHESSMMQGLLRKIDDVVRENGGSTVVSVTVRLGALSSISADHFREHYDHAVIGTPYERTQLHVHESDDIQDPTAQDILLESVELEES